VPSEIAIKTQCSQDCAATEAAKEEFMFMRMLVICAVSVFLVSGMPGHASADGGHAAMRSYEGGFGMGEHHQTAGHLFRHLLKHQKEIGLNAEQVTKLKGLQMEFTRTRIHAEADINVAEAELAALAEDDKADLAALETKVKQSEALRSGLRMAVIKAKRDALAVLTPEQREKQKAEHEKMMHDMQRSHGASGGDMREGKGDLGRSYGGSSHDAPSKEKKEEPRQ
jgi:periplasmic protein CpxP/Spy